jgi:penicillin amidase
MHEIVCGTQRAGSIRVCFLRTVVKPTIRIDFLRLFIILVFAAIFAPPAGALLALALSLPKLDGQIVSTEIASSVRLRRDAIGVVAIDASSQPDAAWALGYAHAQDRYFQMDVMRRTAAGEMSELFGGSQLDFDIVQRRWQLRALARQQLAASRPDLIEIVRAYTRGVNAGVADMRVRPFEYLVLRNEPMPWRDEDSLLIIHSMFLMLTDEGARKEQFLSRLKQTLPDEVFQFLNHDQGEWDSSFLDGTPAPAAPTIPSPPLRDASVSASGSNAIPRGQPGFMGSSAWAVSGRKTAHKHGLLAVDMHLSLTVPNIWYRAEIHLDNGSDAPVSGYGLTVPGLPGFVVGSNGRVAWGFSNSQGDWADLLTLAPCRRGNAPGYRVDENCLPYQSEQETIKVADAPDIPARFLHTRWGPLTNRDPWRKPLVRRWLGDSRAAINLVHLDLFAAKDVPEAIRIARASGIPPVNFVVADSAGRIGWTLAGQLPDRADGCPIDPRLADSASIDDWSRLNSTATDLQIVDPPSGYLVTANQRILPKADTPVVCDGSYQLGARAKQIASALDRPGMIDEIAAMRIQGDDRAVLLDRWSRLILRLIADQPNPRDGKYDLLEARLHAWDHRASADSVAYRVIREYRDAVSGEILTLLANGSGMTGAVLYDNLPQAEYPVWAMVSERPDAWLPTGFATWDDYLRSILDRSLKQYAADDPNLTRSTWGQRNRLEMRHPIFGNVPILGGLFNMPNTEMPGDTHMPLVQAPGFGATQRMVVAPGRESEGLLTMPGGQSANPLSPYFDKGHEQWVKNQPMPLAAGETEHEIHVQPRQRAD